MTDAVSERVERWKRAWESRELDRIAALYEPDATHASPLIARLYPEAADGELRGIDQIREYCRRGLGRFTELHFEILSVTESPARSAIEYRRRSNVDAERPLHVLELIDWSEKDRIRSVRVFHA